jgi:hypothetical protein
MSTTPLARFTVGVVVERRKAASEWVDFNWRPVSVLLGEPVAAPWTSLSEDAEAALFYAGAADVDLYVSETGNYRENLAMPQPSLWVSLRPTGVEPPYELAAVTADPSEGESYTQSGESVVEAVPMPEPMRAAIEAFVAEHHVEQPFYKRKRDRADPEALARRGPLTRGRDR